MIAGLLALAVLCFTACSSEKNGEIASEKAAKTEADSMDEVQELQDLGAEDKKILIAYFSWAENAAETSEADVTASASVLPPGNVAQMASWIQEEVGGDLFSIRVEEQYSADYDECLERAADEKADNARPKLTGTVENLSEYTTVFLGYPNWWYTAPMAVFSFLEENDLSGKKVVLFCSHGTGGLASSLKDISDVLEEGQIEENVLGVYRDDIPGAQETIQNWLEEIGY